MKCYKKVLIFVILIFSANANAAVYETWSIDSNGNYGYINNFWKSLDVASDNSYWGIRTDGNIYSNSGVNLTSGFTGNIIEVTAINSGNAWFTTDANETWSIDSNGNYGYINNLWKSLDIASDNSYWGIRTDGNIYSNSGVNLTSGFTGNIVDITAINSGNAWFTTDTNETWGVDSNGNIGYINNLWKTLDFAPDNSYWGIRTDGNVYNNSGINLTSGFTGNIIEVTARSSGFAYFITETAVVPIPAAVWLFGSGLLGLVGLKCKTKINS